MPLSWFIFGNLSLDILVRPRLRHSGTADFGKLVSHILAWLMWLIFGNLGSDILVPLFWLIFGMLGSEFPAQMSWLIFGKLGAAEPPDLWTVTLRHRSAATLADCGRLCSDILVPLRWLIFGKLTQTFWHC